MAPDFPVTSKTLSVECDWIVGPSLRIENYFLFADHPRTTLAADNLLAELKAYCANLTRCNKLRNRGSLRIGSNIGSTLICATTLECSE